MKNSAGQSLFDAVKHEFRLPVIDAKACVYSQFDQSGCHACVDSCPSQAWVLSDESLGLDTDACDGCGLCIPACPGGALSIEYPWTIRQFGGHSIALYSCEMSGINNKNGVLPCVHILGLRQLLLIYNSGIKHLLITTAKCTECKRCPTTDIQQRLQQLNHLLADRNKTPLQILHRSRKVWLQILNTDEVMPRGSKLSRRDFLCAEGQQYRQDRLMQDPLNLPECHTVPPGQLLPATDSPTVHWPWVVKLDEQICNGCDACMNLCPTASLQYIQGEELSPAEYQLNPADCTGCGICESVCDVQAISINSFSLSTTNRIELIEKKCTSCGNAFHLPQKTNSHPDQTLCRICQKYDHSSQLFQVMG